MSIMDDGSWYSQTPLLTISIENKKLKTVIQEHNYQTVSIENLQAFLKKLDEIKILIEKTMIEIV